MKNQPDIVDRNYNTHQEWGNNGQINGEYSSSSQGVSTQYAEDEQQQQEIAHQHGNFLRANWQVRGPYEQCDGTNALM